MEKPIKERFTTHLNKEQIEKLKILSGYTRVPVASYVREAIDMLFDRYRKELMKAKKKGGE